MPSTRVAAAVGAVAVVAVCGAVALIAATSPSAPSAPPAHVAVPDGAITTATYAVTISLPAGLSVTGTGAVDLTDGAAQLTLRAPVSIATVAATARIVGGRLDVSVPSLASLVGASWVTVRDPGARLELARLGLALRDPHDVLAELLATARHDGTAVRERVTATSGATTTTVRIDRTVRAPLGLGEVGPATITVTTGARGALLAVDVDVDDHGRAVAVDVAVTSYDTPVAVAAPPPAQTEPLTAARMRQLFGADAPAIAAVLARLGVTGVAG